MSYIGVTGVLELQIPFFSLAMVWTVQIFSQSERGSIEMFEGRRAFVIR